MERRATATLVFIKTYSCFYPDLLLFLSRLSVVCIKTSQGREEGVRGR